MFQQPSEDEPSLPVFAAFSDLLACLLGIFVLFFVWAVGFQADLEGELEHERAERVSATDRLRELESALAGPVRKGLISFVDGRIGIRGSVLFDVNSAELRGGGDALLHELAAPLASYLTERNEVLMVSGFTDDLPIRASFGGYRDNWELSAQRSLTVVRTLIDAGIPAEVLFAAGFGQNHPVVANDSERNRAKNRRVELAPVPRPRKLQLPDGASDGSG
ncbi:MAG TPA: OmpA family protein [Polyangiales bacterium]|nr:OmpA family protein [Polyangiales bacterium]